MLVCMAEPRKVPRGAKWVTWPLITAAGIVVGAALGWAGTVVFAATDNVLDKTPYTFVELVEGEVGSSVSLSTVASWKTVPVGTNQAAGTVTSVDVGADSEVGPGDVLYRVGLRPVVIAEGAVPAFRTLDVGTKGADVTQLQGFLAARGMYSGDRDGYFGWRTGEAVRDWQKQQGLDADGVVHIGDIIFVPHLPSRIALDPKVIYRGAALGGGEQAISGLANEPSFEIPVAGAQAAMIPVGTAVQIKAGGSTWSAEIVEQVPSDERDEVRLELAGTGGASICGDGCVTVPTSGQSRYQSEVVTQAPVAGVVAPSAALLSDADGNVSVIDSEGNAHEVSVVATAKGMSVVKGVAPGVKVRIPATAAAPRR